MHTGYFLLLFLWIANYSQAFLYHQKKKTNGLLLNNDPPPTTISTTITRRRRSHCHFAIPPKSPWDELKDRLSGGGTSSNSKYSEGEPDDLDYRPTFEIKEDDDNSRRRNNKNKQRLESIKSFGIGAIVASISIAPITFFHYADYNMAQFELATDLAAIQGGLFAITYRYVSRKVDDDDNNNPMLSQGAVGAFAIVRTLSNIQAPSTCSASPLSCK
eukprot:scaffold10316_cov58-Cylindrotheca_fusiformis.AAC.1